MNNLSSYCGLTDSRMRASDKDLPVKKSLFGSYFTTKETGMKTNGPNVTVQALKHLISFFRNYMEHD